MSTASVGPAVQQAAIQARQNLLQMAISDARSAVHGANTCHSFGAVFAEAAVDPNLGMVRTRRIVAVFDVGKVINEKLARSQFIGGIDFADICIGEIGITGTGAAIANAVFHATGRRVRDLPITPDQLI